MSAGRERIGIIGGGIAGISAAYMLSRKHDVTLLEADDRLGGHANTVKITDGDRELEVDTAFLIFNSHSYARFMHFLAKLGLRDKAVKTDMSIGIEEKENGLLYAVNASIRELFHQRGNVVRPRFLKLLAEIRRFRKAADPRTITVAEAQTGLREFLDARGFSQTFRECFAYPLCASVWSLPQEAMDRFPAGLFFRFFANHKMLKHDGASWLTLLGGSIQYIRKFRETTTARIVEGCPVASVARTDDGCRVRTRSGEELAFDRVVLATHADTALGLLAEPTSAEARLLGAWRYQDCHAVLHTDRSVFPRIGASWPSWNISRDRAKAAGVEASRMTVTYYLNRIQKLRAERDYFVTLGESSPRESDVLQTAHYRHPVFTVAASETQRELDSLNQGRTYFCGSYFGNGFHEDAIASSERVARHFGLEL